VDLTGQNTEALIAVLIALGRSEWFKGAGHVLGVSKLCCPTCHYLLQKLSINKQPCIVRGAHSGISACSLPIEVPKEIVRDMNLTFGTKLKQQLWQFMNISKEMRKRALSGTSDNLSIHSMDDPVSQVRDDLNDLDVIEDADE